MKKAKQDNNGWKDSTPTNDEWKEVIPIEKVKKRKKK